MLGARQVYSRNMKHNIMEVERRVLFILCDLQFVSVVGFSPAVALENGTLYSLRNCRWFSSIIW